MIDYSVIIRTTGGAGDKYRRLLDSIAALEPRPKEIIVVLPDGYALPEERLGSENFCFAPKGMVSQRLYGVMQCKTAEALICDDDIAFSPDFVQKLHEPIEKGLAELTAGPLLSFLPTPGAAALLDRIMGAAIPERREMDMYCRIIPTTGYAYNRNITRYSYMKAESLPWTCFYADIKALKSINFRDESWLEKNGYAALDDQTMFYKAAILGLRTLVVTGALYEHLDARTAVRNNRSNAIYASSFNRVVFWHRFMYSLAHTPVKRFKLRICFAYRRFWVGAYNILNYVRRRMTGEELNACFSGLADGRKYIKSAEYKALPPVKRG